MKGHLVPTLMDLTNENLSDEKQLASIMNKFFINITKSLKLKDDLGSPPVTLNDILLQIFHTSIDKIRKIYESDKKFSFEKVTEEHVRQVILKIDVFQTI